MIAKVSSLMRRRLAAILVAVLVSLAIVVAGPARPAAALAIPPVIRAGSMFAGGKVAQSVATTALCASGVGTVACAAFGIAGIAWTAYDTRDLWMPWVKALVNSGSEEQAGTVTYLQSIGEASYDVTTRILTVSALTATTNSTSARTYTLAARSGYQCSNVGGGTSIGFATTVLGSVTVAAGAGGATYWVSGSNTVCSSDYPYLDWVKIGISYDNSSTYILWSPPVSDAQWATETTVTCVDALGAEHVLTATDSGDSGGFTMPSCQAHGWIPQEVTVVGPDGTLLDVTFPSEADTYPDCFTVTGDSVQLECVTTVWVNGLECNDPDVAPKHCEDWASWYVSHPAQVKCKFGSYVVLIGTCDPLENAFVWNPTTGTVDTLNQYVVDTGTSLEVQSDVDGDGEPDADSETSTGTSVIPESGTNPSTTTGTVVGSDPDSSDCWGEGWSWNPVSWVYVPTKCALKWAFVPQTSLQTRVEAIQGSYTTKPPFSWLSALGPPSGSLASPCPDWEVTIPGGGDGLDAGKNVVCGSSFTGAIAAARPWLAAGLVALAVTPFLRSLAYAAVPIFKPTPTSGRSD
ncbi:hypothetical protein [Nocardioides sp.]|uniref:hypothetical protein n=1 Tax=Nocardioides sp. TaxID=35761 RepID=UPI0039E44343